MRRPAGAAGCGGLLHLPCILDAFEQECGRLGLVGERRNVRILYLVFVSRLLDRIVSAVVKGPSSGGKSFTLETVMQFFPPQRLLCAVLAVGSGAGLF